MYSMPPKERIVTLRPTKGSRAPCRCESILQERVPVRDAVAVKEPSFRLHPFGAWHYGRLGFPWWDAFLQVTCRNRAGVAAREVDFVHAAHEALVAVAKDVGAFSPGVAIDHEFAISREVLPLGTEFPYCAVLRVRYRSGSVWTNPNPPQP